MLRSRIVVDYNIRNGRTAWDQEQDRDRDGVKARTTTPLPPLPLRPRFHDARLLLRRKGGMALSRIRRIWEVVLGGGGGGGESRWGGGLRRRISLDDDDHENEHVKRIHNSNRPFLFTYYSHKLDKRVDFLHKFH